MHFYTLWIVNEISATSDRYFFWFQAMFWSWVSKDQSLKLAACRNIFQIVNECLDLKTPTIRKHVINSVFCKWCVTEGRIDSIGKIITSFVFLTKMFRFQVILFIIKQYAPVNILNIFYFYFIILSIIIRKK